MKQAELFAQSLFESFVVYQMIKEGQLELLADAMINQPYGEA